MRKTLSHICVLLPLALVLAACQPETRILEKPVEVEVTRIVEMPVEVEVTRVVEKPVEVEVTRVVEKPVEVEVTRVIEMPVEVVVTRVVEMPVEIVVTRLVETSVEEVATEAPDWPNVAPFGSVRVTTGGESRMAAVDEDPQTSWSSKLLSCSVDSGDTWQVLLSRPYRDGRGTDAGRRDQP